MQRTNQQLRDDALAIWQAGVAAVDSVRLMLEHVHADGDYLLVGDDQFSLRGVRKVVVVGAGKAGAGMADGLEQALGDRLLSAKNVEGWINVPADCLRPLRRIHLHPARPPGVNEPTAAGVVGAEQILKLVSSLSPGDLCLCLLSGGGSALLPVPIDGITLSDKQAITRHLSAAGANIRELNTVRQQLSRIKGGGLARACRGGHLIALIISDVLGDPLEVIASGPTVPDRQSPRDALAVLEKFGARQAGIAPAVFAILDSAAAQHQPQSKPAAGRAHVTNIVIGNNATAVDAAGMEAERRGYSHAMIAAQSLENRAEDVGRHHARLAWQMRHQDGPDCLITGGEPIVELVESQRRGLGGRNQQLVLAALEEVLDLAAAAGVSVEQALNGIALLSGGTDGEDGPTNAAGARIDASIGTAMLRLRPMLQHALAVNDAYHFFDPLQCLIKTGPTHTNVCDLRVVVTDRSPLTSASPADPADP